MPLPFFSALGGLALILGLPPEVGRGLIALGSLGLVFVFGFIYRRHPTTDVVTMGLGAVMWLVGNLLWLSGESIYSAVPWWAGFCGERLEISCVLWLKPSSRTFFKIAVGVFTLGLIISLFALEIGLRVGGVGLILLGAWLLRFDIARQYDQENGTNALHRRLSIAGVCVARDRGGLWLLAGLPPNNLTIDAMLHTIFLGFVFSMIFGHAPIILPALLPVDITYRSVFYAPLILLQGALVVRVIADLTLRQWARLFNVLAILLFIGVLVLSARRRPKAVRHTVTSGR